MPPLLNMIARVGNDLYPLGLRNKWPLHRRHPRKAASRVGWTEEGRRHRGAQHLGPEALVEAGGMVERGRLGALRECMMSGVTVPPWRSRV